MFLTAIPAQMGEKQAFIKNEHHVHWTQCSFFFIQIYRRFCPLLASRRFLRFSCTLIANLLQ
jgi:hypothetical protein